MDGAADLDELLGAARGGSPAAYTGIWAALSPAVLGFLRARGSREAEDLTSEVFLAAFTGLPTFVGGAREFRSLLFTIAHRRLVDELRARGRRPVVMPLSDGDENRWLPSAEEAVLSAVGSEDARALLDTLAPDQRDVLTLRIFGDLTVEQVAWTLDKSVGAVKQLQRRGLEALRRRIVGTELAITDEKVASRTPGALLDDTRERP